MTNSIAYHQNITEILDRYDTFLVDLWGVIHDGIIAYEGVAECLDSLHHAGKKIIFISNAPRRAIRAVEGLQRVGVADHLYDHVITSGEVTYQHLIEGNHEYGKNYYIIGPERDDGLMEESNYFTRVMDLSEADFTIVTGFDHDASTLEEMIPELEEVKHFDLPMICANPDLVVVRNDGTHALCAGVMAAHYEKIGGTVQYFGKPHQKVYQTALELAGETHLERVAAIGDSLITDIKGGNELGVDTYLIPGGILGRQLGISHGELPDAEKLHTLCQEEGGIFPTAVLPALI